jgi:chaperonin GroES
VLAAGDGGDEPLDVHVGETVVFDKYAGTEIEVDGETRLIIDEEEIMAVEE